MVLQIMDIYPESLLNKLPLTVRSIISFPLKKFDAWIAKAADRLVVISDNMRRVYAEDRGIKKDRILKVYTWQDESRFASLPSKMEACCRYGMNANRFTFLYLGNIGPVAGVDFLIRAFSEACLDNAQLIIVGDGAEKRSCAELVEKLGVPNVHFISDPDAANVPLLQSMADVCMLPLKRGAGLSSIPSKLPAYLFSAKPVLATVDLNSDTASLLSAACCGWIGEPENSSWLSAKMRDVSVLQQAELTHLGKNGRAFGLNHFSKSKGVRMLSDAILLAGSNSGRRH
jgi:glycosyltransferase involved in cell wall biosynthesis